MDEQENPAVVQAVVQAVTRHVTMDMTLYLLAFAAGAEASRT